MKRMGRSLMGTIAGTLLLTCSTPSVSLEAPLDERLSAYRSFRDAFDAGRFSDALASATRVVDLTRSQYGAEAQELVNPLVNLGSTYLRLREHEQALDQYRAALSLLELEADNADPRLIPPLHGLGRSLLELGRGEEAIVPLKRAVDITRNREGLYAYSQMKLLRPLTDAYMSSARLEDAGREQQYAFTIAENTYGKNDVRLLQSLDDLARWNESAGRYTYARLLHGRAVQLAESLQGPSGPVLSVPGLRGLSRTHRLAYMNGETEEAVATANDASMADSMLRQALTAPSSEGERALRIAADRLKKSDPVDSRLLGEVLIDLGDWQMTAGNNNRALAQYREAWASLGATDGAALLGKPVPVTYHPPSIAVSRGTQDADRYETRTLSLRVSVDADGEVREAQAVDSTDATESAERALAAALKRSRFRPAFVDGAPISTTDTLFSELVYIRRAGEGSTALPAATASTAP